jgi:integrase
MKNSNFTESYIKSIELTPGKIQEFYWDKKCPGFGVMIGKTKKTYVAQGYVNGKAVRTTIGPTTSWHLEMARKEAKKHLSDMCKNENPNTKKQKEKLAKVTIGDAFNKYIAEKKTALKKGSLRNYQDFFKNHLSEFQKIALTELTHEQVLKKYADIQTKTGKVTATNAFKFLQTLYSYIQTDSTEISNPITILSRKKLWHRKTRRQTYINASQIKPWFNAVMNLENDCIRDLLQLLMLTGLRKNEAMTLRWENVDFKNKSFTVPDTKNGTTFNAPMNDLVLDILNNRFSKKVDNNWVFPGKSAAGHVTNVKKAIKKVENETGIKFCLHDLRRSFITIAESLSLSDIALKRLLNHATSDVTSGYIINTPERLRTVSQQIADEFKKLRAIE